DGVGSRSAAEVQRALDAPAADRFHHSASPFLGTAIHGCDESLRPIFVANPGCHACSCAHALRQSGPAMPEISSVQQATAGVVVRALGEEASAGRSVEESFLALLEQLQTH